MHTRVFLSVSIAHFVLLGLTMLWMEGTPATKRQALTKAQTPNERQKTAREVQLPKTRNKAPERKASTTPKNLQVLLTTPSKELSTQKIKRVRFWRRPPSASSSLALLEKIEAPRELQASLQTSLQANLETNLQAKIQTKIQIPETPKKLDRKKTEDLTPKTSAQKQTPKTVLQNPAQNIPQVPQVPQTPPITIAKTSTLQKTIPTKLPPIPSIQNSKDYQLPQNILVAKPINPSDFKEQNNPKTQAPPKKPTAPNKPQSASVPLPTKSYAAPAASQNRGSILDAVASPQAGFFSQGQNQEQSKLNWEFQWDKDHKGQNASRRLLHSPKMNFPRQALQDLKEQSVQIIFQVNSHGRIVSASFADKQLKAYNWQINSYLLEKVRQFIFENSKNQGTQALQLSKGIVTFHFTPSQSKSSSPGAYSPIIKKNPPHTTNGTNNTNRQVNQKQQVGVTAVVPMPAERKQAAPKQAVPKTQQPKIGPNKAELTEQNPANQNQTQQVGNSKATDTIELPATQKEIQAHKNLGNSELKKVAGESLE